MQFSGVGIKILGEWRNVGYRCVNLLRGTEGFRMIYSNLNVNAWMASNRKSLLVYDFSGSPSKTIFIYWNFHFTYKKM